VRNILDFPAAFDPIAEVVTLDRNYRSTQPILDAANAVIGLAKERFTKNLWTDRESSHRPELVSVQDEIEQARFIASRTLQSMADQPSPIRALGRMPVPSRLGEEWRQLVQVLTDLGRGHSGGPTNSSLHEAGMSLS
jgi:superfamily I DNA/RNA helicase